MLSIPHMIVVFIVVLVVFGPQKLPELARGLGKLMAEFRKASTDFRSAFEEEMRDLERQSLLAERKKAEAAGAAPAVQQNANQMSGSETPAATASEGEATVPGEPTSDAPMISPVAEAVPRSAEEAPESKNEETPAAAAANFQDTQRDPQHPA